MQTCIHCDYEIENDTYNFCSNCDKQIRCLNPECRVNLKAGKTFCLVCGTPTKEIPNLSSTSSQQAVNSLFIEETFSETTASRTIKAEVSDSAVVYLADTIAGFNSQSENLQKRFKSSSGLPLIPSLNRLIPLSANKIIETTIQEEENEDISKQDTLSVDSLTDEIKIDIAKKFFKEDADKSIIPLEIIRKARFGSKENTEKSKSFALSLLFICAYEFHKNTSPTKSEIYRLIREEKFHPGNFRRDFTGRISKEFLKSKDSNSWTLDFNGEREVLNLINQINNPTEIQSINRKTKVSRIKRKSSSNSSSKLKKWLDIDINDLKINTNILKNASDWSLLIYYLLINHLDVEKTSSSGEAYDYAFEKFKVISIKRIAFQDHISRSKKMFSRSVGGEYRLIDDGIKKGQEIFEKCKT
jgi:hypothetical protein